MLRPPGAGRAGEGRGGGRGAPASRRGGGVRIPGGNGVGGNGVGGPGGGTARTRRLPEFFHRPEKVWEPAGPLP